MSTAPGAVERPTSTLVGASFRARRATSREWDEAWAAAPTATFTQSRAWCELWCSDGPQGLRPDPVLLDFDDGTQVVLPLACSKAHKGLVTRHFLAAGGGYGSALSGRAWNDANARAVRRYLLGLSSLYWVTSPIDPPALGPDTPVVSHQETHLLDLRSGPETVLRGWSRGHRSALHKAHRTGVTVGPAGSDDEWRDYYTLYEQSLERWGDKATSRYGFDLFERIARLDAGLCTLWLARYDGESVAGAVCFYAGRHVWYWHGASLERALHVRPATALMHGAIEHACASGRWWFDFGFSGGHDGVATFKRGFGALPVSCPIVKRTTPWVRAIAGLARLRGRRAA